MGKRETCYRGVAGTDATVLPTSKDPKQGGSIKSKYKTKRTRQYFEGGRTSTHTWYRKKHKDTEGYEDDEGDHQEAVAPSHRGHGKVHNSHVPDVTQSSNQPSSAKQLQKDTTTQPN